MDIIKKVEKVARGIKKRRSDRWIRSSGISWAY